MSSGFLLDTSVLSMLAPGKPKLDGDLAAWMRDHSDALYVSAITIAEVEQGVCKLRRSGGAVRADALTQWIDALIAGGQERVLPFDAVTARIAGEVSDKARAEGRHPGFADVAIAATAIAHDLRLLTRNVRHFAPLGVVLSDPTCQLP